MQCHTFEEIKQRVGKVTEDTLLVVDIDHTLVVPSDPALQPANLAVHRPMIKKHAVNWTPEFKRLFKNVFTLHSDVTLIESTSKQWIDEWIELGGRVLALTASKTGDLGLGESPLKRRQKQLMTVGFDFSKSFANTPHLFFEKMVKDDNSAPVFEGGVLLSNWEMKGKALTEFFRLANYRPKRVVFVDDQLDMVLSVAEEMEKMGILVDAFEYLGAENFSSEAVSFDEVKKSFIHLELVVEKLLQEADIQRQV